MNLNGASSGNNVKDSTITNVTEGIEKNIYEIISLANEVNRKIYGDSTPKITDECCSSIPVTASLERTLNNIHGNSKDLINMLNDILKNL